MKNPAEKYIEEILSGEVLCGEFERLAVERHVRDLREGIDRGLYFDQVAGRRALRWFTFLQHSKGSQFQGKPFDLSGWEAFIVWSLFGWKNADDTRRFRKAYISVAKKNGKTTFGAAIALYMMKGDKEARAEIYSAATKRDQARYCFDEAKNMIRVSPGMSNYFTVYEHSIFDESTGSYFQPLSADYKKQDGLNPHFAIIDEYHAHKDDGLVNNIQSGMGARVQPLLFYITTAGFDRTSPCYEEEEVCKKILQGILDQDDKFAMIFSLDEGDDWEDMTLWRKANPNMDISVTRKFLESEYKNAKNNNRKIVNFQTKNLNMWVDSSMSWIRHKAWKDCNFGYDPEKLIGKMCYGGLDLASHVDFNWLSMVFDNDQTGGKDLLCWAWIPEAKLEDSGDRVDYRRWRDQGWLKVTPGNVVDIDTMLSDIIGICHTYDVQSIGVDPARLYHGVSQGLQKEGITLNEFRQNTVTMDTPTRELEKLVLERKLNHGGNPILAWMISNVEIMEDTSGNIKASKGRSRDKIDGVVATIMALGESMAPSNYFNFS